MGKDRQDESIDAPESKRAKWWWLIIALLGAVAAGVLLASTVWDTRFGEEETLPSNAIAQTKPEDLEAWCAAQSTYDAIRLELFRRAAQVRGSDEQAYKRLADFALLRMSGPVVRGIDDRLHAVSCSATAYLDLPPGVRTSGGQNGLSGDMDYVVQPSADKTGNVVRLGNSDSIVVPLATLSRIAPPQMPEVAMPDVENLLGGNMVVSDQPSQQQPQSGPQDQQSRTSVNPSFDCGAAGNRTENAVCSDPGLAALDRQMADRYRSAVMQADKEQRRLLERTRDRFLGYRNRCATNQCIAETYRSRIREIDDIMSNRWRG